MRPLNIAATVRYLPCRGSQAAIIFFVSNICWVSSGTVKARYCWLPRAVRGANPGIKKWSLGNGTIFVASFLKSALSCPGNLRHVVIPDMVNDTKWFKSPYVGVDSLRVLKVNIWLMIVKIMIYDCYIRNVRFNFECALLPKTNVIKCFIINWKSFVSVFYELVDWQRSIVRLNNSIRHFRRGNHAVGVHNPIWVLLPNFWNEQCSHSRSSAAS